MLLGINRYKVLDAFGVRRHAADLYWRHKFAGESPSITYTVGDAMATFNVASRNEYIRLNQFIEADILERFLADVHPSDVMFDIGANIGEYAALTSRVNVHGAVVAFDPAPSNAERTAVHLENNARNEWSVYPIALGDKDGVAAIDWDGNTAGTGQHRLTTDGNGEPVSIRRAATLIDSGEVMAPDIVKIDVEGAEGRVLAGFGDWLSRIRVLYVEVHVNRLAEFNDSTASVVAQLRNAGFEVERIESRENELHLRATTGN